MKPEEYGFFIKFLIQSAVDSFGKLGFVNGGIRNQNLFCVLSRMTIGLYRPLKLYEKVEAEICPKNVKRILYFKDYLLRGAEYHIVGRAAFVGENVAAGLAGNGDLIVISSGWSDPTAEKGRGTVLPPLVDRSTDGGLTWYIDANAFFGKWPENGRRTPSPDGYLVPFGDILPGDDGQLYAGLYSGNPGATFVYTCRDGGKTWGELVKISENAVINEPALFIWAKVGGFVLRVLMDWIFMSPTTMHKIGAIAVSSLAKHSIPGI